MMTLAEIRERLEAEIAVCLEDIATATKRLEIAEARLAAHDEAVKAARAERRPLSAENLAPADKAPRAKRRNLRALVLELLGSEPKNATMIAETIGNISVVRVIDVLSRLRSEEKAMQPPGGSGWVRHPSLLVTS